MYLRKSPVAFIKDGERRLVYHTVTADELLEDGWMPEENSVSEMMAEAPAGPAIEVEIPFGEPVADLESMTKSQLVEYAASNDIDVPAGSTKAEILAACMEVING